MNFTSDFTMTINGRGVASLQSIPVIDPAKGEPFASAPRATVEDLDRAVQLLALQLLPVEAQAELAEAIRGVKAP